MGEMMPNDIALLREYAQGNSEQAFATLVSQYVNLVYSVALRQVRDAHLAEEITQAVFIILARKAGSLHAKTILSGWLCRTARYASADALKIQRRRQRREQEAYMQSTLNEPENEAWVKIAPLLDTALAHLGETDHNAIVLRFFERKSMKEVGAAAGVNEDAAKKRVNRALEKLRRFFMRRGIVLPVAVMTAAISANSVQAAPVALAKSVTILAISKGSAASGSTLTLIKGALKIMAWTKIKVVVVTSAVVLLTAGTTTVAVKVIQNRPMIVQGKEESEWIKSIVYNGDDNQRKLWHSLGPNGIKMLVRAMRPPPDGLNEEQASASRKTRMCAADLLCQLGDYREDTSAVPDVIKLLNTEKYGGVRGLELGYFEMPIQSMSEKDKAALLPQLIRSVQGSDASERNNALVALQYYPNQADTVVPLMANALQDPVPGVRLEAVRALAQIDPQNATRLNLVAVAAGCITSPLEEMPGAVNDAVVLLGQWHREPDVAVPVLIQSLQNADAYVRENAAAALGKFGGQARSAVAALQKATEDTDAHVRRQAALALKRINAGNTAN